MQLERIWAQRRGDEWWEGGGGGGRGGGGRGKREREKKGDSEGRRSLTLCTYSNISNNAYLSGIIMYSYIAMRLQCIVDLYYKVLVAKLDFKYVVHSML